MSMDNSLKIIIALAVTFLAFITLLGINQGSKGCFDGDLYNEDLKLCGYSLIKDGDNAGKTVEGSVDCNAENNEVYTDGQCYYEKVGFINGKILITLWILFAVFCLGVIIFIVYMFLKRQGLDFGSSNQVNKRFLQDYELLWANMGDMPIIEDKPQGKFKYTEVRAIKRDGKDFQAREVFIEGCEDDRYNGIWTWVLCLNNSTDEILNNVATFIFESTSISYFDFERRKFPYTTPKSYKDNLLDKLSYVDDDSDKDLIRDLIKNDINAEGVRK